MYACNDVSEFMDIQGVLVAPTLAVYIAAMVNQFLIKG